MELTPTLQPNEKIQEEYIIKCTHPAGNKKIADYSALQNYPRCNSHLFYVKWNTKTETAFVMCSKCKRQLFEYAIPKKQNFEEVKKDGTISNISDSNNISGNNSDSSDNLGSPNNKISSQNN